MTGPAFDPQAHLFLEEVEGTEAIAWVQLAERALAEGAAGGSALPGLLRCGAEDRDVEGRGFRTGRSGTGYVYNFWQDETHERGLWRRATLAEYGRAEPKWETLLDVDALAKAGRARTGSTRASSCLPPANELCLVELSDGGKDAARHAGVSTFPSRTGGRRGSSPAGSTFPRRRHPSSGRTRTRCWCDGLGRGDTLTESGYPFVVKRLKRGQKLGRGGGGVPRDEGECRRIPDGNRGCSGQALVRRGAGPRRSSRRASSCFPRRVERRCRFRCRPRRRRGACSPTRCW